MDEVRRYEFEGLTIDIPIHRDEQTGIYIEDYPDFIKNPVWTPEGNRVLFSGTDACSFAEEKTPGGCPDCGSCKYFRPAGKRTWFGVCGNERNKRIPQYK